MFFYLNLRPVKCYQQSLKSSFILQAKIQNDFAQVLQKSNNFLAENALGYMAACTYRNWLLRLPIICQGVEIGLLPSNYYIY